MRKAIAIDFDGCLCEWAWPGIGAPHWPVIRAAQSAQREGTALILWTCRCGELLEVAVEWCRNHGLIFDAINENLPERLEHYGCESRKVSADEYWDDRAVHMPKPPNDPLTLEELREMDGEPVYIVEGTYSYYALISGVLDRVVWLISRWDEREMLTDDYGKTWLAYRRKLEEV